MKAMVCREFGEPGVLRLEELPSPVPNAREVLIAVEAADVGFQDILMVAGKYQSKPPFPFSPGNVVAGTVRSCGTEVTGLVPGDPVIAILSHGGYAEDALAPAAGTVKLPPGLDAPTAAALGMAYGTAYSALVDRGALARGEVLLVRGAAGGVGLAAVDLGRELGATVIAAASSPAKLAAAAAAGAHHLVDTSSEVVRDRVLALTDGRGADVIFDPVGTNFTQDCLRSIARKGRILIVGFAGGEIPAIPAHYVLNKYCSIVGVSWGRSYVVHEPARLQELLGELLALAAEHRIHPRIDRILPLARAAEAMGVLAGRGVVGRILLDCRRDGTQQ